MSYEVTVADIVARPTAVIAATTTWQAFPTLWGELLGEVWACLRAGGIDRGCPNVMLYWDDVPHVEVGVELSRPCALTGRVVMSALPAGKVAAAVHRGPYTGLASAHRAVIDCAPRTVSLRKHSDRMGWHAARGLGTPIPRGYLPVL